MKVQKTKEGKLRMKVKRKEPIISHWSDPKTDEKADREFGRSLRNSEGLKTLKQVSDRKYIDTRESINKKD